MILFNFFMSTSSSNDKKTLRGDYFLIRTVDVQGHSISHDMTNKINKLKYKSSKVFNVHSSGKIIFAVKFFICSFFIKFQVYGVVAFRHCLESFSLFIVQINQVTNSLFFNLNYFVIGLYAAMRDK